MKKPTDVSFPLLKYRLVGVSTEDPENPFYSLISGLKNDGWCSVRYSTYPQELLIQFCRPCRLRQVNLLLHEYKIPSKIDLYYFFPKTFSEFNLDIDDLIFEKMGYIIPNLNKNQKKDSREYKQIFLNENVYYLKFVFHQNYPNLKNVFNQVGLIFIQCFGIDFTANNINGLYPNLRKPTDFLTQKSLYPQVKKKGYDDSMMDEVCIMKLKELKEALDFTLKIENYDESKKVTDLIQLVRKIGEKINDAKETKNKALEVEDWDTCKIVKIQIDNLREKVREIDVGYLGFKDEGGFVEVGTQPVEEEKENIIQEDITVKESENGGENESIREKIRFNA
jgi:centrosomal protein CEP104